MNKELNLWIMGPSCAGKTTLAKLVVSKLSQIGLPAVLCDGDEVRDLFDTKLGYDAVSRARQTMRVMSLARWVQRQGMIPVVAIIHPFEADRAFCRKELPGYTEIYLKCIIEERIRRDGKNLYLPALRGEKKNVIDVDIPFEAPDRADLILDSGQHDPTALLNQLIAFLRLK